MKKTPKLHNVGPYHKGLKKMVHAQAKKLNQSKRKFK